MNRPQRILTRVIAFLLLGAIVNVAVAWGCASLVHTLESPFTGRGQTLTEEDWLKYAGGEKYYEEFHAYSTQKFASEFVLLTAHRRIGDVGHVNFHVLWRAGLPVASLEADGSSLPDADLKPGIDLDGVLTVGSTNLAPARCLPLRPVWPGFAINTIFYASILWLLFFVPGSMRRSIRHRRGLCPACAYPVGTSPVCTECGKAVTSSRQTGCR